MTGGFCVVFLVEESMWFPEEMERSFCTETRTPQIYPSKLARIYFFEIPIFARSLIGDIPGKIRSLRNESTCIRKALLKQFFVRKTIDTLFDTAHIDENRIF